MRILKYEKDGFSCFGIRATEYPSLLFRKHLTGESGQADQLPGGNGGESGTGGSGSSNFEDIQIGRTSGGGAIGERI